jgi:hypothetical protein
VKEKGFGGLEVWRFGGLKVWRFGGLEVWRFGGLEVWRFGGSPIKHKQTIDDNEKSDRTLCITRFGGLPK